MYFLYEHLSPALLLLQNLNKKKKNSQKDLIEPYGSVARLFGNLEYMLLMTRPEKIVYWFCKFFV